MAVPLVGKMARAAGRALMPGLFKSGLGPNQIYKALKFDYKFTWRRADMFKDIRSITGLMRHETQVRGLDPAKPLSKYLVFETDLPAGRNYRFYADVETENLLTGGIETRRISFYINKFDNPNDAMKQWQHWKDISAYNPDEQILSMTFVNVEHNKGAPW